MNSGLIKITETLKANTRYVGLFFVVFYAVGFIGLQWSLTQLLFVKLIPFALLLSFAAALIFHQTEVNQKSVVLLLTIFILSFLIELVGVNTGLIFGTYRYGEGLGLKIYNTPIIIGINWAFLVYFSSSISKRINVPVFFRVLAAASMMLVYDLILEQSASRMDMWYWKNDLIPLKNYIAWFFISLFFNALIAIFNIKIKNPLSLVLLILQAGFFFLLYVFKTFGL